MSPAAAPSGAAALLALPWGVSFAHPWALLALGAVPPIVWTLWRRRLSGPTLRLPSELPLLELRPSRWARLWWLPSALVAAALALTAVGLSGPRGRKTQLRDLSVEGIDIVVAFDLSTSMLAADFKPKDRITVAKEVLKEFIASRQNDRIGLVVFAAEAYTQCPLTLDYRVLEDLLDRVRIGVIDDGTAIGNAVATAVNRLRDSDAKSRVVVLITDGDNNAGNISPAQAARIARELGIKVFAILIGKGGRVPYPVGTDLFGRTNYEQVEIDVNPGLLREIAQTTGGELYAATDRETLESGLSQVLGTLEKSKISDASAETHDVSWAASFFAPAALLAGAALLLRATRMRGAP